MALLDQKWAFDVVSHDATKDACYLAGVVETEWCLLDDILWMDQVFVSLMGVVSRTFQLGAGTGQGKKFSLHALLAYIAGLREDLVSSSPPANASLPPFVCEVLDEAEQHSPSQQGGAYTAAPY